MKYWICVECGWQYGTLRTFASTMHYATCDWCGKKKPVTVARDYGWPA